MRYTSLKDSKEHWRCAFLMIYESLEGISNKNLTDEQAHMGPLSIPNAGPIVGGERISLCLWLRRTMHACIRTYW